MAWARRLDAPPGSPSADWCWRSRVTELMRRCDREPVAQCQAPGLMGAGNRSPAAASSQGQGLADLAQSWCYLATQLAPEVPELPAVIQQEVGTLASAHITEDLLKQKAVAIAQRVQEAGLAEQAGHLLHRMGRPMYELLLLLATEEELRAAGMIPGTRARAQDPGRPAAAPIGPRPDQVAHRTVAPDRDGAPAALAVVRPAGSQDARPSSTRVPAPPRWAHGRHRSDGGTGRPAAARDRCDPCHGGSYISAGGAFGPHCGGACRASGKLLVGWRHGRHLGHRRWPGMDRADLPPSGAGA